MNDNASQSGSELPLVVYSPESGLSHPLAFLAGMVREAASPGCRDLSWRLLVRNVAATYRQSLGGILWMFATPVLTAAVWIFLNAQEVLRVRDPGMPYAVFVMVGNLVWSGFVASLAAPVAAVQRETSMLTRLNFPREALLIAGFGELLLNSFVPLVILVPLFLYYKVALTAPLLLAPLAVVVLLLFGFALGLLTTPFGLLFHDVNRAVAIVSRFWFFATPIIYPMPERGVLHAVAALNPATPFVVTIRELLTGAELTMLPGFLAMTGVTVLLLLAGLILYRVSMPHVIERMSA